MNNKVFTFIKSIIIPVGVGLIIGLITSNSMNYSSLEKPLLAPPSALFPIVWTILYILMGVSYGILKTNSQADSEIDKAYYTQLIINALWPIFFFVFEWRLFAFIWLILLIISVINMIIKFYDKNKLAGLLQIPYLIWCTFAAYLNLAIYILNR